MVKVLEAARSLRLTQKEKDIFDLLKECISTRQLNTTLRVAGGWVRDKLLGNDSSDIDIAIDTMMGSEFAEHINSYLKERGEDTHTIGVIKTNPDQSKHLETATMKLKDQWIDLVNLRSEEYTESSRIPTMRLGTPSEDAYRRDFTINTLFYNINQDIVEDFTERGLEDLEHGVIRTPLPPLETFLDDPLRVLRAIRFASRFEFTMMDDLQKAAGHTEVRTMLRTKISRERVGKELTGMLKNNPTMAFGWMLEMGLYDCIFTRPDDDTTPASTQYYQFAMACLYERLAIQSNVAAAEDPMYQMSMVGVLLDHLSQEKMQVKKNQMPVAGLVIQNAVKLSNNERDIVVNLQRGADLTTHCLQEHGFNVDSVPRSTLGMLMRQTGKIWALSAVLCEARAVAAATFDRKSDLMAGVFGANRVMTQVAMLPIQGELPYIALLDRMREFGLQDVYTLKPLITGKELQEISNVKPGPGFKNVIDTVITWQLANPEGSKDECEQYIRQTYRQ
eukprot:GFYU01005250.1.p1 GENE.GFYU01005250.1~~GFYU01005250.1.p1  ORF type:complete len:505 (+),score=125.49 GFYU01005250.1:140-1654(+)